MSADTTSRLARAGLRSPVWSEPQGPSREQAARYRDWELLVAFTHEDSWLWSANPRVGSRLCGSCGECASLGEAEAAAQQHADRHLDARILDTLLWLARIALCGAGIEALRDIGGLARAAVGLNNEWNEWECGICGEVTPRDLGDDDPSKAKHSPRCAAARYWPEQQAALEAAASEAG